MPRPDLACLALPHCPPLPPPPAQFVRPLFRALRQQPATRDRAPQIFERVRAGYHPIAAKMVAADLQLAPA